MPSSVKSAKAPAAKSGAKPAKPAAEPPAAKPAAEPPKPAAEPPKPAAEPPAADAKPKKTRQQTAAVLDVDIPPARAATHLRAGLDDPAIVAQREGLATELKAAKAAGNAEDEKRIKDALAALAKSSIRRSMDAPIVTAVICDAAAKEIFTHGADQTLAEDRRNVEVSHIMSGDVKSLTYYPLICKLPTYSGYNPEHEAALKAERAAQSAAAKKAREAKKGGEAGAEARDDGEETAEATEVAADDAGAEAHDDAAPTKTSFATYVDNAIKSVKTDEKYATVRVSTRVREYISAIVAELIAHLAALCKYIAEQNTVRTVTADHLLLVVGVLFVNEGRTKEEVAKILAPIRAKLATYSAHVESERKKKAEAASLAMDDAKKAEIERKKQAADLERKRSQAVAAKARALELSEKAATLDKEVAKLAGTAPAKAAAAPAAAK